MTMKGTPVPPEGLDHIKGLEKWLEQYPNDAMVRTKLADLQRDPRFAEPDEPDDIMPEIPALTDFPVPPGLKKYVDAVRTVAGASIPTSAACVTAAFNLLAAEDVDVKSLAQEPHPSSLYHVVGSESGWRKTTAFRQAMQGHVEADERVDATHHEAETVAEDGTPFQAKGFSPPGPQTGFYDRGSSDTALESTQDHGRGQLRRQLAPGRLVLPQGQPQPQPQPLREPVGWGCNVHRPEEPRQPRDILLPEALDLPDHGTGRRH